MMWVKGPAGTGKTAIPQTIAERCAKEGLLAASFFFSYRAPETRHKNYVIPTLAYQLAQNVYGLGAPILAAIERDPHIFSKNMQTQMDALIMHLTARGSVHVGAGCVPQGNCN